MKVLEFSDVKMYEIFFESLSAAPSKGEQLKKINKVIKQLKKIGTPKQENPKLYTLAEAATVEVEDDRFNAAKQLCNEVQFIGPGVESGADLLEWLDEVLDKEKYESRKRALKDGIITAAIDNQPALKEVGGVET